MKDKGNIFIAQLMVLKDALEMVGGTALFKKRELFEAGLTYPAINAQMSVMDTHKALGEFVSEDVEILLDYTKQKVWDYCDTEEGNEVNVYILGLYVKDGKVLMDGFAVDRECEIYTYSKRDLSTMGWIDLNPILNLLSVKTALGIQLLSRSPKRKNESAQFWAIVDGRAYPLDVKNPEGVSFRALYSGLIKHVKAYLKDLCLRH